MAEVGGSHCSEPQSGERPDLREAGHAHLKAGVFLPRLKGPIDRSWELHPQGWDWPTYHGHQNHPRREEVTRLQTLGPSPETWTWLVCSGPEESCSSQCQDALGFHPSLGTNYQCGEILAAL